MGACAQFVETVASCCAAGGLVCLMVILVLGMLGLGIAKIVIGIMYLHDCDIETMIPIFLIVSALVPLLYGGSGKSKDDKTVASICAVVALLFNIAWLICGSVWVYGTWGIIKSDSYIPCGTNVTEGCTQGTCSETVLNFAFAMVTLDWVLTGLVIVIILAVIIRTCCSQEIRWLSRESV